MTLRREGGPSGEMEALLKTAIDERRLVSFTLHGCARVGEPHDLGIIGGSANLFFFQLKGESGSGAPLGWRWARLPEISGLRLLDEHFPGSRPAPSGRHVHWDELWATVSPREKKR